MKKKGYEAMFYIVSVATSHILDNPKPFEENIKAYLYDTGFALCDLEIHAGPFEDEKAAMVAFRTTKLIREARFLRFTKTENGRKGIPSEKEEGIQFNRSRKATPMQCGHQSLYKEEEERPFFFGVMDLPKKGEPIAFPQYEYLTVRHNEKKILDIILTSDSQEGSGIFSVPLNNGTVADALKIAEGKIKGSMLSYNEESEMLAKKELEKKKAQLDDLMTTRIQESLIAAINIDEKHSKTKSGQTRIGKWLKAINKLIAFIAEDGITNKETIQKKFVNGVSDDIIEYVLSICLKMELINEQYGEYAIAPFGSMYYGFLLRQTSQNETNKEHQAAIKKMRDYLEKKGYSIQSNEAYLEKCDIAATGDKTKIFFKFVFDIEEDCAEHVKRMHTLTPLPILVAPDNLTADRISNMLRQDKRFEPAKLKEEKKNFVVISEMELYDRIDKNAAWVIKRVREFTGKGKRKGIIVGVEESDWEK